MADFELWWWQWLGVIGMMQGILTIPEGPPVPIAYGKRAPSLSQLTPADWLRRQGE